MTKSFIGYKLEKIYEMVNHNLMWGRPLRSIFAIFNEKKIHFKYHHLTTTDNIIIEQDLEKKKNY